jgi:hypothetical protein
MAGDRTKCCCICENGCDCPYCVENMSGGKPCCFTVNFTALQQCPLWTNCAPIYVPSFHCNPPGTIACDGPTFISNLKLGTALSGEYEIPQMILRYQGSFANECTWSGYAINPEPIGLIYSKFDANCTSQIIWRIQRFEGRLKLIDDDWFLTVEAYFILEAGPCGRTNIPASVWAVVFGGRLENFGPCQLGADVVIPNTNIGYSQRCLNGSCGICTEPCRGTTFFFGEPTGFATCVPSEDCDCYCWARYTSHVVCDENNNATWTTPIFTNFFKAPDIANTGDDTGWINDFGWLLHPYCHAERYIRLGGPSPCCSVGEACPDPPAGNTLSTPTFDFNGAQCCRFTNPPPDPTCENCADCMDLIIEIENTEIRIELIKVNNDILNCRWEGENGHWNVKAVVRKTFGGFGANWVLELDYTGCITRYTLTDDGGVCPFGPGTFHSVEGGCGNNRPFLVDFKTNCFKCLEDCSFCCDDMLVQVRLSLDGVIDGDITVSKSGSGCEWTGSLDDINVTISCSDFGPIGGTNDINWRGWWTITITKGSTTVIAVQAPTACPDYYHPFTWTVIEDNTGASPSEPPAITVECTVAGECPMDCTECCSMFDMTISGTGTVLDRTLDPSNDGLTCSWIRGLLRPEVIVFQVFCDDGFWYVSATSDDYTVVWRQPVTTLCPPTEGYTLIENDTPGTPVLTLECIDLP